MSTTPHERKHCEHRHDITSHGDATVSFPSVSISTTLSQR